MRGASDRRVCGCAVALLLVVASGGCNKEVSPAVDATRHSGTQGSGTAVADAGRTGHEDAGLATDNRTAVAETQRDSGNKGSERWIDQNVVLRGIARNAKAGAVVVTDDGLVVYLEGLDGWPEAISNRKVEVSGLLREKKHIPDPVRSGELAQGAWGEQLVLERPQWKVTE